MYLNLQRLQHSANVNVMAHGPSWVILGFQPSVVGIFKGDYLSDRAESKKVKAKDVVLGVRMLPLLNPAMNISLWEITNKKSKLR